MTSCPKQRSHLLAQSSLEGCAYPNTSSETWFLDMALPRRQVAAHPSFLPGLCPGAVWVLLSTPHHARPAQQVCIQDAISLALHTVGWGWGRGRLRSLCTMCTRTRFSRVVRKTRWNRNRFHFKPSGFPVERTPLRHWNWFRFLVRREVWSPLSGQTGQSVHHAPCRWAEDSLQSTS